MSGNRPIRVLVYGDIGGSGGYIRYCQGVFASRAIPKDMEVYLVCSPQFFQQIKPLDSELQVITHSWPASLSRVKRYGWHILGYPRLVQQIQPDIEFYPSGQLRVYLRKAITVSTCHNLLLFDHSELERFTDPQEHRYFLQYRKRQAGSYRRASGVIFLSDHSRRLILDEVPGIRRHAVIPHGLNPRFRLPVRHSYEFGSVVRLLYVSTIHFYKHHSEVVRAMMAVRRQTGLDVRLRIVGDAARTAYDELMNAVSDEGAEQYVEIVGSLDTEALIEEYSKTDLFVFASTCETFGITLLEAMGARLPIACSNRTGLPDILKDAGVYFDPEDPKSISAALLHLIQYPEQRRELGERAYQYSLDYTWERCAQLTFRHIRDVYMDSIGVRVQEVN